MLSDPRQNHKVAHQLSDMIAIALCATICGVDHWVDVERFARIKINWYRRRFEQSPDIYEIHLRNHWTVENSLHWSLDVTFSEDTSRIRKGNGQAVGSALRRVALSMLKQNTTIKSNLRGKRLMVGWNSNLLKEILSGK